MNSIKRFRKGQSLPMNTIVIAILVIIVLLVIIVFFTNSLGETGSSIEDNGQVNACSVDSNPAIKTLGYSSAKYVEESDCDGEKISIVKNDEDDNVCCGWK